jgi:hypothetical protein
MVEANVFTANYLLAFIAHFIPEWSVQIITLLQQIQQQQFKSPFWFPVLRKISDPDPSSYPVVRTRVVKSRFYSKERKITTFRKEVTPVIRNIPSYS